MKKLNMLLLLIVSTTLMACGSNDANNPVDQEKANETVNTNTDELQNNEPNEDNDNDLAGNGENYEIDTSGFVEVETDIDKEIDQIYAYYNSIYYANPELSENIASISASSRGNNGYDYETSIAYTFKDVDDSIFLHAQSSDLLYTLAMKREDDDGNQEAKQIKDDLYYYKENFIWPIDESGYSLTIEDPEEGDSEIALSIYDNMVETNNELDEHETFYREAIAPKQIPDGYELLDMTLSLHNRTKMPKASINFLYTHSNKEGNIISVRVDGKYEETPSLNGDAETFTMDGVTYQTDDEFLFFTLGEETYSILSSDLTTNQLLGIAQSIIEQDE